jgi:hypothetical protein
MRGLPFQFPRVRCRSSPSAALPHPDLLWPTPSTANAIRCPLGDFKRNSSLVYSPASQRAWCGHNSPAACCLVLGSEQSRTQGRRARTPLGPTRPGGSHHRSARLQARPNVLAPSPCFVTKGSRRRHLSMNWNRKSKRERQPVWGCSRKPEGCHAKAEIQPTH